MRPLIECYMETVLSNRGSLPEYTEAHTRRLRQSFLVNTTHGLHARPCALLIKTLQPFDSEVRVEANGEQASGHSIMSLMALAAGCGCRITFTITGDDALEAMAAVRGLFDTHFAEAYRLPPASKNPTDL